MWPLLVIGSLAGTIGSFFSHLWESPQPLREVRVQVTLETLENRSPRVGWYNGSVTRDNLLAGVDLRMPVGSASFEFKAIESDPSVAKRTPAAYRFAFTVSDESTTHYELEVSRTHPENRELTLIKYAPSNYPETVLAKLAVMDAVTGQVLRRDLYNTPDRGYRPNDWVHSWDCSITQVPPSLAHPDGLYALRVSERPLEFYFEDPQTRAIAHSIQEHRLTPVDLSALPVEAAVKASVQGVTLLHWAVRFQNKVFLRWFLDQKLTLPPLAEAQGSPIVMATRWADPEPLIGLVKLFRAQGGSFQPLELPFLIDNRPDAVQIFQALKNDGLLTEKGVRHSLTQHWQMKLNHPAGVGDVASRKLNAYMPLLARDELYPTPGEFSEAEATLAALIRAKSLLAYYQRQKGYQDRIEEAKRTVARLERDFKRMLTLGSPITPAGVCYVIHSEQFFSGSSHKPESGQSPEPAETPPLWSEVFTSTSAFDAFRHYVATDRGNGSAVTQIAFAAPGVRGELSSLRKAVLAGTAPKEQRVGPFRFQVQGGHLKRSGVVGVAD